MNRRDLLKLGSAATIAGATGLAAGAASAAAKPRADGTTLIHDAAILSMDDGIGDLARGDLLLRDGRIADVDERLPRNADHLIDGRGRILIPGFVDGHRHLWQTPMRGSGTGWSFSQYIREMLYRRAVSYEPDDMYVAGLAGGLEALNAGVTSVVDHCHNIRSPEHAEAALRGMRESGVGGVFGLCYGRTPEYGPGASVTSEEVRQMLLDAPQWRLEFAEGFRKRHFASDNGPVKLGIATSFFETFAAERPEEAREEMRHAYALGVDLVTQHVRGRGEFRVVPFLEDSNLLGPKLMLSHADRVTEAEMEMLADQGTTIVVTPETELKGGNSPALGRATAAGVPVGLGMDTVIMVGGDMFGPMRWVMQFQRYERHVPRDESAGQRPPPIDDRDALRAATIGGARAAGLGKETGSLTPGKRADVVMFRADSLAMQPVDDPVAAIVHYAHTGNIDSVWVAGKPVKRNGSLLHPQLDSVIEGLKQSRQGILERAETITVDGNVDLFSSGGSRGPA